MTDELGRMALTILGELEGRGGTCTAEALRAGVVRSTGRRWTSSRSVTYQAALKMLLDRGELTRLASLRGFEHDLFQARSVPLADPSVYVGSGLDRRHIGVGARAGEGP